MARFRASIGLLSHQGTLWRLVRSRARMSGHRLATVKNLIPTKANSEGLHDAHSQQETLQIGPVKHQWLAYLGQRAPRSRLAGAPVSQPSEPMHLAAGLPVSERPPPSPRWSTARHTRKAGTRARRRSRSDWKFTRRRSRARRKDFGSRSSTCPTATCQSARSRPSRARRSEATPPFGPP